MRLIKFLFGIFLIGGIAFACTVNPVIINQTHAEKITTGQTFQEFAAYYALPRTVVDVTVVVEKQISKPGPFASSAERYLGISQVITREKTEYRIKEIQVTQHAEKDPDQMYRITTVGSGYGARVSLTPEGVISGINLPWKPIEPNGPTSTVILRNDDFYFPTYPDLSVSKNIEAVADTTFWKVRTDTSFINIPLLKERDQEKTMPMQVEDAANTIYKLRKRRFYILNGIYAYDENVRTPMPEGQALEVIVRELGQMEHDYMSLFIGRTQTEESVYHFSFTPEGKGITEAAVLFAFSSQRGVLLADDTSGDAIRLQLTRTDENILDKVILDTENSKNPVKPGIAYRTPEKVLAEITRTGETLFERELLITQFGRIDYLPDNLLKDEKTSVEFYANYGSIKSIYTK